MLYRVATFVKIYLVYFVIPIIMNRIMQLSNHRDHFKNHSEQGQKIYHELRYDKGENMHLSCCSSNSKIMDVAYHFKYVKEINFKDLLVKIQVMMLDYFCCTISSKYDSCLGYIKRIWRHSGYF